MPSAEHEGITGVTFDSDGHRMLGTLYLARDCTPKPTALLLHGCPGLQQNADLAVALRDRGWNSLVFHYRGCWGSGGDYDLRTIPRDVRAAVDHLQDGGYPGVDPARLAVAGHSLGGWAAILAAAAIMGSHVRVGLEDSLYLGRGQIAESNADQVTKIRGILEALSLEIATPAEARQLLGLKGLENVGY